MTITGTTRIAAVLGHPVEHTRSPAMLNAAFAADQIDTVMVPIDVAPEGLAAVIAGLRAARCFGASVTIPHKLAVAQLCDELSTEAKAVGAVNCLQFGEQLIGYNTDADGFADSLAAANIDLKGKRVIVLGTGGAARAVAHGVRAARAIEVLARKPAAVGWAQAWPWTEEHLRDCFERADLVVDCTSACMTPDGDEAFTQSLPLDALPTGAAVATLVYHRKTNLLERASSLGHSVLDGRGMLVHQGARAFTIWTGLPAPLEVMIRALDASLAR